MKMQSKLTATAALCLALSLSACGGSTATAPDTGTPVVEAMIDAFTKFVTSFISSAPDDQEPQATDSVALTVPEEVEPVVVN